MAQTGEPAPARDASALAAPGLWAAWNGRRLVWRNDVARSHCGEVELCIDDVIFERIVPDPSIPLCEREFAFSPSGRDEIVFSLRAAGGGVIGSRWHVLHGRAAPAGMDQWQGDARAMRPLAAALPPRWTHAPATAIVVPIYNSPHWVQCCITALLRWTSGDVRLILIDDASGDAQIATLLAAYADRPHILVRRNADNLGYTRSTNLGIELAGDADVVLLNSDTQVGPRWLQGLRQVAYADERIGTVTAVSDNAGAFSVPELEQACAVPSRWSLPMTQRALLQNIGGCLPELPTGNGFCMFVKRALLDRVGVLDAEAFPSGYGEENDLCQRAERVGYRHVIAGNVFVHHERSASFGAERRATLGAQGMQVLRSRYPDYEARVGATLFSFERRVLDYRVRRIYADRDGVYTALPPRPRVLLVVGRDEPAAVATLVCVLRALYECFVLSDDAGHLRLWRYQDAGFHAEREYALMTDAERCIGGWLLKFAIELVHVFSAQADNRGLQVAAACMDVPVLDSGADAQFQVLRRSMSMEGADPAASVQLADYCNVLYPACWRDHARFADVEGVR
ncbi:MAG: glycosyltransferase [Rudaea sp.]|nr:glycosyltransferase [Rudaea sp.]